MTSKKNSAALETFLHLVSSPLLICDGKGEKILMCNESSCEIFGYGSEELKGVKRTQLFDSSSSKIIQAAIEILETKSSQIAEKNLHLVRKSGRKCPIRLFLQSFEIEGTYYLAMNLFDLTEEKKNALEKQKLIRESARVAKLADIGQLAAGMAHELNNPLAIMSGYLDEIETLLEKDSYDRDELFQYFQSANKASKRIRKIVSGMLSHVRSESQELKPTSLKKLVEEVFVFLDKMLSSQAIQTKIDVEDVIINCNQLHIDQIITNIVSNACNALFDVSDPTIKVSSEVTKNEIILKIWNNGESIPDDIKEKLFTPFFTTKGVGKGTGLGLYMSYQFMQTHGGNLKFESDPLHGTTFFLHFPSRSAS